MSNTPIQYQPRKPKYSFRDDVAAEWGRFVSGFTRENIVSHLKTLAWVVPLTLLIWIYAEREQVQPAKDVAVPFELESVDQGRVVSLRPPQDKNLVLELQGPQARLQELLMRLRTSRGGQPQGLRIEVPTSLEVNREHALPTLDLVRSQKIFADFGVTVLGVQPARLDVMVDQIVEREARVLPPPSAKNLDATFDPPVVRVRGPLSLLNRALQTGPQEGTNRLVVYAELPEHVLDKPGHYDLPEVVLTRPAELQDDRVTIVTPGKIRSSLDVRQPDKTLLRPSMTVTLDVPEGLLEKYKVVDFRPAIQFVTLIGRPEVIDAIDRTGFLPQPKARLVITQQDAGGDLRSKVVEYDLPKGVDVSPEDRKKTVEFRLVDRETAGAG